jgi:hypothetical protein
MSIIIQFFVIMIVGMAVLVLMKLAPGNKFVTYAVGLVFFAVGIGIAYWGKWKLNLWFFLMLILATAMLVIVLF